MDDSILYTGITSASSDKAPTLERYSEKLKNQLVSS